MHYSAARRSASLRAGGGMNPDNQLKWCYRIMVGFRWNKCHPRNGARQVIEIVDARFGCGSEPWLRLLQDENGPMDYSYVLEQLFAQMMGWA